jgi:predicted nuclease of predicted toxin-antitoxin system
MKFLIDAQLPPDLCPWLVARGHEAEHVFDIGLGAATDAQVAEVAEHSAAVLVSKDEDFLTLQLARPLRLLWLRCGNVTNRALTEWLETRWAEIEARLADDEPFIEVR